MGLTYILYCSKQWEDPTNDHNVEFGKYGTTNTAKKLDNDDNCFLFFYLIEGQKWNTILYFSVDFKDTFCFLYSMYVLLSTLKIVCGALFEH